MGDNINNDELLQYAVKNGIIDLSYMQEQVEMQTRKELLDKHPYKIWEGKDGKWYTRLPDGKGGKVLKKRNTREQLEDVVVAYWKAQDDSPTIKDVFTEWNDRQLEVGNIKSSTHYRNIQVYDSHLKRVEDIHINKWESEDWECFLQEELDGHRLTSRAFGNLKAIVRGMLNYARRRKIISYSPSDIFPYLDINKRTFKVYNKTDEEDSFTLDEYYKILDYLSKKEHQTIHGLAILLMFVTGMRVGELVSLQYADITNNIIHISKTETRYRNDNGKIVYEVSDSPKTAAGNRDVPIPKDFRWILKAVRRLNPFGEYIFMYRGKRITTMSIRKQLYSLCDTLDIPRKSPHKARKTYASILLDSNVPEYTVKTIMGHTDTLTTEKFYHRHITNDFDYEIIDKIPEFMAK